MRAALEQDAVHWAIAVMQSAVLRLTDQNLKDTMSGPNNKGDTNV
jgi:hypothetical protein